MTKPFRIAGLFVGVIALVLLATTLTSKLATVQAATVIGNASVDTHCDADSNGDIYEVFQLSGGTPSYVVPANGTLTSFRVQHWSTDSNMQFTVWRNTGGSNYMLVYIESSAHFLAGDATLTTYSTFALSPAAVVQAGDVIGHRITGQYDGGCLLANQSATAMAFFGTATVGQTFDTATDSNFIPYQGYQVNIEATFELPVPVPVTHHHPPTETPTSTPTATPTRTPTPTPTPGPGNLGGPIGSFFETAAAARDRRDAAASGAVPGSGLAVSGSGQAAAGTTQTVRPPNTGDAGLR